MSYKLDRDPAPFWWRPLAEAIGRCFERDMGRPMDPDTLQQTSRKIAVELDRMGYEVVDFRLHR